MAEYIERDSVNKVLDGLIERVEDSLNHSTQFGSGCDYTIRYISNKVGDIPAADVRPERYGKWGVYQTYLICLECNFSYEIAGEVYKYCPNCGAKMKMYGKDTE